MELHLIVEAETEYNAPTELLCGRRWQIRKYKCSLDKQTAIPYHCISYRWGQETGPNLFGLPGKVSARTRDALGVAINAYEAKSERLAFWIDAVCVPFEEPARRATLESMGFVYAEAESVIVVLQSATYSIISRNAQSREPYAEDEMHTLNKDTWVDSVWSYQELVNAKGLYFTASGLPAGILIDGEDFLNSVGFSLHRYETLHNVSALEMLKLFPALSAITDVIADYCMAGYQQRSILTCLTGINGRYCDPTRPTNRLYAVLGALTQEPSWGTADDSVAALTEKIMRICERKGDFSYIYTSDEREAAGPTWRPRPLSGLIPVLGWYLWGQNQPGKLWPDGNLELEKMVRLDTNTQPTPDAVTTLRKWLGSMKGHIEEESSIENIESQVSKVLSAIGFTGNSACHRCRSGLILTQHGIDPSETLTVYASGGVRWAFGAPGIGYVLKSGERVLKYTIVVYVGLPLEQETKETLRLELTTIKES